MNDYQLPCEELGMRAVLQMDFFPPLFTVFMTEGQASVPVGQWTLFINGFLFGIPYTNIS